MRNTTEFTKRELNDFLPALKTAMPALNVVEEIEAGDGVLRIWPRLKGGLRPEVVLKIVPDEQG